MRLGSINHQLRRGAGIGYLASKMSIEFCKLPLFDIKREVL